jgi:CubicO group peptidase (beta-lactamase class C family)
MKLFRLLLSLAFCSAALLAQDVAAKIDEYLQAHSKVNRFMGSVLVAKGGKIIFEKGYGFANIELNVPNTPDTKFRLGSITKQFTATAIMQLQERGKLSVEDPICKFIDNCPETWKPVTVHNLLTHTSGIPSYTNMPEFRQPKLMRVPLSPIEIAMLSKDKPLEFQPGEKMTYNNTGYVLLGHIVEKASGEKYADYLKNHIFSPLDMNDSGYDDTRTILRNRASGYSRTADGYRNADFLDMSLPHAAGSLYSTVRDLYRWDRALYGDKAVSRKSLEKMFTPVKNNYGYGFVISSTSNRKQIAHGGGINGFSTVLSRFPDDDAVVIVLSNFETANAGRIGTGLGAILFGEKYELPQERKEIALDSAILDRYAGKYDSGKLAFTVTNEGGRLFIQATGQGKLQVYPYEENKFFLRMIEATVEFNPKGAPATELILNQNGRLVAKRVE